ncbi:MAG: hypothetical protein MUO76_11300 [Anaerolineaceae bacterium]|nr:hypothetical protein [Anaerolineaceae bacterium]
MLRTVLAIFIIAHGLVHAGLAAAPNPDDPDAKPGTIFTVSARSWLLPWFGLNVSVVKWIGITLVALSTLGFVLAGLGIFGVQDLVAVWRTAAVLSACVSLLLLLILFWHRWFPVGILIDIGVLIALLWARWPPVDVIGS